MKQLIIAILLFIISLLSYAGEKVDRTLDASSKGTIYIEHLEGKVAVKSWDKQKVWVSGTLHDQAEELYFEQSGDNIYVTVEMPRNKSIKSLFKSHQGDNLEIFVPRNSKVDFEGINSEFSAEKIDGRIFLSTVNGSIDLSDISGNISVETVNGLINSRRLSGDIKMSSVNGKINDLESKGNKSVYRTVKGDVVIQSHIPNIVISGVSADINLDLGYVEQLFVNTVSGNATAKLKLSENGELLGTSVSGDIRAIFVEPISASFDLETFAGGEITNNLSEENSKRAKFGPNRQLKFHTGEGTGKVKISSVSGTLTLDKPE